MWSAVVARELGIISRTRGPRPGSSRPWTPWPTLEAPRPRPACSTTGTTRSDGSVVTVWPEDGNTVTPFLSSVDNGWLAAALRVVEGAMPELRGKADRILSRR